MLERRRFLSSTAAVSAGFLGLDRFLTQRSYAADGALGYGPLLQDKDRILDLPKDFRYTIVSRAGDKMDDGLRVPGRADGMGAFAGANNTTILVRNHENDPGKGAPYEQADVLSLPADKVYDRGTGTIPATGGTTTLVVDNSSLKVVKEYMSLAGTLRNCAGGVTPWNSWISCEETVVGATDGRLAKDHGYCFEVPAESDGPVTPQPIKAMGRFNHEAIAIDPKSGAVYLTEDRHDSLIYRYLPTKRRDLQAGGRLQVLVLLDQKLADTRNWKETEKPAFPVRQQLPVKWVDIDDVDSPRDDLRYRGAQQHGAAIFARGEGIFYGNDAIYWACTNGGRNKLGQIFRYVPSEAEGAAQEEQKPGMLDLFVEPNDGKLLEYGDNICVSPWGDLIVCEDGKGSNYLVGVNQAGELYRFGKVSKGNAEFAGSVFSSDGKTLFVNIQNQGLTIAITGPWQG